MPQTPVHEFHRVFGLPAPSGPSRPSPALARTRLRLLREEFEEVAAELEWIALHPDAPYEEMHARLRLLLKELCDVRYIAEGTAVACGLDIETAFVEVHRSNMSKLYPDGRPGIFNGKVLKGPNYSPADMALAVPDIIDAEAEEL